MICWRIRANQKNVIARHPKVASKLRAEFVRWFKDVTDGVEYSPVRIPVGHRQSIGVEISPSWSKWTGANINYTFDGYDWDTIDGWKEPGEKAVWRLDVQASGQYSIRLSYGCRPLTAGGRIRISSGDESVEHMVRPTTTAEQFDVFDVGQIKLELGPSELTAEVVSSNGGELMRLNKVILKRVNVK